MDKTNLVKSLLVVILQFNLIIIVGQVENFESNNYLKDFDFFIKSLVEIHPDPYSAFGGQIDFYLAKKEFQNVIKNVANDYDFAIHLNKFASKLEDGHTFVNIPDYSDFKAAKKLPLKFKIASDFLFIQNASDEYKNVIGKKIIAVNDIPIQKLLEETKKLHSSENISGAYFNLVSLLKTNLSIKPLFGKSNNLKFTFSSGLKEIEVSFKEELQLLKSESGILNEEHNKLLYWQMLGNKKSIGYVSWNGVWSREYAEWTNANQPGYIESHLSWLFRFMNLKRTGNIEKDIRKIPSLYEVFYQLLREMKKRESTYLIIDLRENGGGMTPLIEPVLYMLHGYKYLSFDFEAEYIKKISVQYAKKIGFETIDDLNKALSTNFKVGDYQFSKFGNYRNYLPLMDKEKVIQNGYYGFGAKYVQEASQEIKLKPNIVVLCSPKTFSAAFHFMYFLKKLGNTTIVGVASRQAGNSFMETTNFELPETKLIGSISNAKQILFKTSNKLGQMLKPDIEMSWKDYEKYNFDKNAEVLKTIEFIESNY